MSPLPLRLALSARAARRSAAPQGGAPHSLHPPSPDRIRGTGRRRRSRRVPQGPRLAQALRHPAAAAGRSAARRARRLAGQGQAARLMPRASAAGAVQSPSASSPRGRLTTIDCATPQVSRLGGFSAPRSPPRMGRRRALALGSRGVLQICAKYPNLAQPRRAGAVRAYGPAKHVFSEICAPTHRPALRHWRLRARLPVGLCPGAGGPRGPQGRHVAPPPGQGIDVGRSRRKPPQGAPSRRRARLAWAPPAGACDGPDRGPGDRPQGRVSPYLDTIVITGGKNHAC